MILTNSIHKLKGLILGITSRLNPDETSIVARDELKKTEESDKNSPQEIVKQLRGMNLKQFETIEHFSGKRDYSADFKKYFELGITPHVFIDSLMTVHLDCRSASLCVSDQINIQSIEHIEMIAREIKRDYNLYLDLLAIPLSTGCMLLLVFFKDVKLYNRLENMQKYIEKLSSQSDGSISSIFGDQQLIKELGECLSYPKCCIDFCVSTRKNEETIELKTLEKLRQIGKTNGTIIDGETTLNIDPSGFFSFEFYPCNPLCKKAGKIGKTIIETFSKQSLLLAKAFKFMLFFNVNRVLVPQLTLQQNEQLRQKADEKICHIFLNGTV